MFKNYLKIAWRNLIKRKVFTTINVLGLAIGISCSCLILLWAEDEINYDSVFAKQDLIHFALTNHNFDDGIATFDDTPGPLAHDLKEEIPEITRAARTSNQELLLSKGDNGINRTGTFVDPDFLDIFGLRFVEGEAKDVLDRPDAIVLTQKTALALFGENVPAMDQVIKINNEHNFTVRGVVADLPHNVTFGFEFLLPFESYGFGEDVSWAENYANNFTNTFVELAPNADFDKVDAKVRAMIPSKLDASKNNADTYAFLHSIKDWHLRSEFQDGKIVGGQITLVRLMLWIAAIILIIACINFINLSTAQSEKRGKEVGVRKVLGSQREGLVSQFMVEENARAS
ncbi:MAG: ABC transporter permease [Bacteroidota bacterium]